jgi:hypothetical protein
MSDLAVANIRIGNHVTESSLWAAAACLLLLVSLTPVKCTVFSFLDASPRLDSARCYRVHPPEYAWKFKLWLADSPGPCLET